MWKEHNSHGLSALVGSKNEDSPSIQRIVRSYNIGISANSESPPNQSRGTSLEEVTI